MAETGTGTLWASHDDVREAWPDALMTDDDLDAMMAAAQEQLEAYAPASQVAAIADGGPVPARYARALLLQTQALWQAQKRDGDVIGYGEAGYAIRVRPLGQDVRSLIRPRRGKPAVR